MTSLDVSNTQARPAGEEHPPSILAPDAEITTRRDLHLRHAVLVYATGYLILVAAMLAIGFTLTHLVAGPVGKWDASVDRWFAANRTPFWNRITGDATFFVNTLPAIGIAALITAVLAVGRRGREAAMLVLALVLELTVFLSVTWVVHRRRPQGPHLNSVPSTSSFPSGHTAAATVLFVGLAVIIACCTRKWVPRVLAFVLAVAATTLIGFARVYRGMHFPSDAFAGVVLGAGCLLVAVLVVRAAVTQPADDDARTSGAVDALPSRQPAAESSDPATRPA